MNLFAKRLLCLMMMITVTFGTFSATVENKSDLKETALEERNVAENIVYGYSNGNGKNNGNTKNEKNGNGKNQIVKYKEKKNNKKKVNYGQGHGQENKGKAWGQQMIHASSSYSANEIVRVAVIDSGVNYNSDLNVVMRKNFIPDDEVNVLYEDSTGHGTAVAGIIGALENEEGITGVNPGVEIYSARVLDRKLEAPVERIVEAIDWAIEQKVDIINMSFGLEKDVDELEMAIKRADDAGILLIAAAGNNGVVSYPAAYEEVIAVGAIDAEGNPVTDSAEGEGLELMAPGENILSSGIFGGMLGASGTSMAAPHVVGVASVLMELNPDASADYIRELLNYSANLYGDAEVYGNGVVDMEYAITINDKFKKIYEKHKDKVNGSKSQKREKQDAFWKEVAETIPENEKDVEVFSGVEVVEGLWLMGNSNHDGETHKDLTLDAIDRCNMKEFTEEQMQILTYACGYPDSIKALNETGQPYHGHLWEYKKYTVSGVDQYVAVNESNYIANVIFLTKIGDVYGEAGTNRTKLVNDLGRLFESELYMYENDLREMENDFGVANYVGGQSFDSIFKKIGSDIKVTSENKKLFMYGIAIHTLTDVYAHSTFSLQNNKWQRVKHNNNDFRYSCDNPTYIPARWTAAESAAYSLLAKYATNLEADLLEFYRSGSVYGTFYLGNLCAYAKMVDPLQYSWLDELLPAGDLWYNRNGKTIVYEGDFKSGSISHSCRPVLTPEDY